VTTATAPSARRTQAERRASSRARLLNATLSCLAELGYAGSSLPEIVRRAGLSNGGLWRHFHSKAELMAAASLEADQRLLAAAPERPAPRDADEAIDGVVDQILDWSQRPEMVAIIELLLASRADPQLHEALSANDERAATLFADEIRRLLGPHLAAHPHFRVNARQLGLTLYGIAVTYHLRAESARRALTAELRDLARRLFDLDQT
jgi:AcrR family transcriptional regulator